MEVRQLQYFLAVARELNFTRAAATLHVTVPPLTRQIQALERELGLTLFDRSTHHVALTDAGAQLSVLAASIIADIDAIPARLRGADTTDGVRISVPFSLNSRLRNALSSVISRHAEQYAFAISQIPSRSVAKSLQDNRVDFSLSHVKPDNNGVDFVEVDRETLGILVDTRQFCTDELSVRLADLEGFSYVHGPESWEIDEMISAQNKLFAAGIADKKSERYQDLAAMLIALGDAPKLTLRSAGSEEIRALDSSQFRVLPISDLPLHFTTYLAWRSGESNHTALRGELAESLAARS